MQCLHQEFQSSVENKLLILRVKKTMAITSCTRLALLVFASVAMLGQLTTADVCSKSMGPCDGIDCNAVCLAKFPDSKGECNKSNLCTCFFDCSKQKYCDDSLGTCSAECRDDCCAQKCASKYHGGVGYCQSPVFPYDLCQCKFPCE